MTGRAELVQEDGGDPACSRHGIMVGEMRGARPSWVCPVARCKVSVRSDDPVVDRTPFEGEVEP